MSRHPTDKQPKMTVESAYAQALDHFSAGRYSEVDKFCTAIVNALPNHVNAINLLGVIAQKVNRHDLAVEKFQQAIDIDNNCALLYYNLGTSLNPLGRRDEAIKALKTALSIEPENDKVSAYLHGILENSVVDSTEDRARKTLIQGTQESHLSNSLTTGSPKKIHLTPCIKVSH
ncbi:MAG: hypothetical protein HQL70_06925 [Magnetococcales bacterium]|nr:hypothetical protein [Magnetococcales bacterium]